MPYKVYGFQKEEKRNKLKREKQLYSNDLELRKHITLANFSNKEKDLTA